MRKVRPPYFPFLDLVDLSRRSPFSLILSPVTDNPRPTIESKPEPKSWSQIFHSLFDPPEDWHLHNDDTAAEDAAFLPGGGDDDYFGPGTAGGEAGWGEGEDESVMESLLILGLMGVLAWLVWYRNQRVERSRREREREDRERRGGGGIGGEGVGYEGENGVGIGTGGGGDVGPQGQGAVIVDAGGGGSGSSGLANGVANAGGGGPQAVEVGSGEQR